MALKDRQVVDHKVCAMARLVDAMSKEDLATLVEWINSGVTVHRMIPAFKEEYPNHPASDKSVAAHLRGHCHCTDASDPVYGLR